MRCLASSICWGTPLIVNIRTPGSVLGGGFLWSSTWAPDCWFMLLMFSPPEEQEIKTKGFSISFHKSIKWDSGKEDMVSATFCVPPARRAGDGSSVSSHNTWAHVPPSCYLISMTQNHELLHCFLGHWRCCFKSTPSSFMHTAERHLDKPEANTALTESPPICVSE